MENSIPVITSPLGEYWQQPKTSEIEIGDTHAVMGKIAFDQLLEYSTSTPSGVYIGKMWKGRYKTGEWYLAWFSKGDDAETYLNNNYRIILDKTLINKLRKYYSIPESVNSEQILKEYKSTLGFAIINLRSKVTKFKTILLVLFRKSILFKILKKFIL